MAIIDDQGLFLGDRMAKCSDDAQLHWPRLYLAANNFARLELNYRAVRSAAYSSFSKPITEDQFWSFIKEYRQNFMLFVYKAPDGSLWGQWQTNERYLPRYKTAADRRSPVPPVEEQEQFRKQYIDSKTKNQRLTDLLKDVPSCLELSGFTPTGVGVGVGVGEGEKPKTSRDKRESPVSVFVLPEWIDREAWDGFEEMRSARRRTLTDRGRALNVGRLTRLKAVGYSPADVLNQSVENGWLGLWKITSEIELVPASGAKVLTLREKNEIRRKAS